MGTSKKEITRANNYKKYSAYISKDISKVFDRRRKEEHITFSNWLRIEIDKYLQKR